MRTSYPSEMRAYFFGNLYISQIQHGIQGSHIVTKLFRSNQNDLFPANPDMEFNLHSWADYGVTKIFLQAGFQRNLEIIYDAISYIAPRLDLPYVKFHEEEDALNGALTSVGIVVPTEIYNMKLDMDDEMIQHISTPVDIYNELRLTFPTNEEKLKLMLRMLLKSAKLA